MKLPIARILAVRYIDEVREKQRLTSAMAEADPLKVSAMKYNESAVLQN
jgi:hypothetical protein